MLQVVEIGSVLGNISYSARSEGYERRPWSYGSTHTLDLSRGKLTMYPGKIDAFLEYQNERREHDLRVNATVHAIRT